MAFGSPDAGGTVERWKGGKVELHKQEDAYHARMLVVGLGGGSNVKMCFPYRLELRASPRGAVT